ncbi:unnamed protein product [Euphydryas editha]|uniref:Uncharacterized protein n=1 Tax=Euphydryas editha TaxID=104508 RepID=A0AAU9UFF3_EUPED|nr:unnamed protein product [Euphydryas editha]
MSAVVFRILPSSSDSVLTTGSLTERISNLQQVSEQGMPPHIASTLHRNKSSLHSGSQTSLGGSMTSLSSAPPTPTPASSLSTSDLSERPRVNHGKPNLAPKPPVMAHAPDRPSPPPKKLIVNGKLAARAQSMRVPRSPPVSPPSPSARPPPPTNPPVATKNPASHFGTLRAPRGLRPPGVCPPPPPGAPPPPPAPPARAASLAQPPPPPPPHHHRLHPADEGSAPAPPARGSSMRAGGAGGTGVAPDLEARFAELFNPLASFPLPDPFLRIAKDYSSTTVAASKAPAPAPPLRVPLEGWSGTSSAC